MVAFTTGIQYAGTAAQLPFRQRIAGQRAGLSVQSKQRDQQCDREAHRPGGAHQKGAQKADTFTIFGEKPGDQGANRRHDGVKH